MDCLTARQTLEPFPPNEPESAGEEVLQAQQHVQNCPDCQMALQRADHFDRQVSRLFRNLPVPVGLKDRIHAQLDAAQLAAAQLDAAGPAEAAPRPLSEIETTEIAVSEARPISAGLATPALDAPVLDAPALATSAADGMASQPPSTELSATESPVAVLTLSRRRFWGRALTSAAACIAIGLFGWWQAQRLQTAGLELTSFEQQAAETIDFDSLPLLAGTAENAWAAQLPATMIVPGEIRRMRPRQMIINGVPVAVYQFSLRTHGRTRVQGRLVMAPRSLFRNPPTGGAFLVGGVKYIGHYSATSWTEGDVVYLCCLSGGDNQLERLYPRNGTS